MLQNPEIRNSRKNQAMRKCLRSVSHARELDGLLASPSIVFGSDSRGFNAALRLVAHPAGSSRCDDLVEAQSCACSESQSRLDANYTCYLVRDADEAGRAAGPELSKSGVCLHGGTSMKSLLIKP